MDLYRSFSVARLTAGGTKGGSPPDGGGFCASTEVLASKVRAAAANIFGVVRIIVVLILRPRWRWGGHRPMGKGDHIFACKGYIPLWLEGMYPR